jgi:Holliday junction DNA helicase RuvB
METQHTDLNQIGPSALNHLVGQRSVIEQVRVALEASFADGKPFDHCLCVGPAGCGKTQTAKVIAAEMASEFHEVLGQALESPAGP